jgi:hypothetical protein
VPLYSLISSGTETASIHRDSCSRSGRQSVAFARDLDVAKKTGPVATIAEVRAKFTEYAVLGYSGAGVVAARATGDGSRSASAWLMAARHGHGEPSWWAQSGGAYARRAVRTRLFRHAGQHAMNARAPRASNCRRRGGDPGSRANWWRVGALAGGGVIDLNGSAWMRVGSRRHGMRRFRPAVRGLTGPRRGLRHRGGGVEIPRPGAARA